MSENTSANIAVTVNHGANGQTLYVPLGSTVEGVYNAAKDLLNLPERSGTRPEVTGVGEVDWSHQLTSGQILTFSKATGDKG